MTPPPVTLVIPTYNRERLVVRALESALTQTYPAIEILVVDDGSSDNTGSVLEPFTVRANVRVIRHAQNLGATAAKNTGLDAVRSPFATILDSDDQLVPHAVDHLMKQFALLGSSVGMVFANCVNPVTGAWTGRGLHESGFVTFRDAVTARFQGEFWGIWRMAALGTRRFDTRLPGGESIVWHDMYRTTQVYYLHEALRLYHTDTPDRVSRLSLLPANLTRTRLMYEAYLERFGDDMKRLAPAAYARQLQAIALWHLLAGERLDGWRRLAQSVGASPTPRGIARAAAMAVAPRALLRHALERRRR